jgi:hypothetical protein
MLTNGVVTPNQTQPEAPINQPCADEMPQPTKMQFHR